MTRSRTWTLGTAIVVLVVLALGWFLVISPKKSSAADLRATAAATVVQNQGVEAKIRELKLQQKALPAQQAQIAAIAQQMPAQPQLPSLLRQINNAADAANVSLAGIAPSVPAPVAADPGVAMIPVVVTATGNFTHLKQFLFALEENKRAVLVTGFTIGKADAVAAAGKSADPEALAITITTRVFMTSAAAPTTVTAPSPGASPTGAPGTAAGAAAAGNAATTKTNAAATATPNPTATTPATAGN